MPSPFSYLNREVENSVRVFSALSYTGAELSLVKANQLTCYQTATTPATHKIVKDNLHLSVHIQETKKGELLTYQGRSHMIKFRHLRSTVLPVSRVQDLEICA